jgi:serine/threonine-protein kinase
VDLLPGATFGPYRILAPLGRGGMAAVYRAHDPALDRDVALKVLPAEFLHDPAFAERFRHEARVAARLEHPHVVPIHGYGIEDGRPWMAMRLLGGGSLADRVKRGALPPAEAAAVLQDVAGALDYAHARGVVHRDVKPANVLLDEAGRAYLADFGIARMLEGSPIVTATGLIQGSPSYMAPEQAMGAKVDRLADVYALGVMSFECLTGRVPYTGTTPVAILMKHVQEPVPQPPASELAPPLAAVVRRALAKAPADRWPSAGALADALAAAAAGAPPPTTAETLPTLVAEPTPAPPRPPARSAAGPAPAARRPGRRLAWAAAAILALAGGVGLLGWLALPRADPPSAPSPAPTVLAKAAPSPAAASRPTPTPPPSPTPWPSPRPTPLPTVPPPTAPPATAPPAETPPAETPPAAVEPEPVAARPASGRIRVYCEAKLEPALFKKSDRQDVVDSVKDLVEAIGKRDALELVGSRAEADAVVQVLERGREPAVIGMRKVRVRVLVGATSVELTGQDSIKGFNTWSGAANGASKQVESWLKSRFGVSE